MDHCNRWASNLVDQADDGLDTEMVEARDEETTALVPHLELVLAFLRDQVALRRALHALEEAHHDAGYGRVA